MPSRPPPFYSLDMSNGAGQGATPPSQNPIEILQTGYQQGQDSSVVTGGAGRPGPIAVIPLSLDFGSASPGDEKYIKVVAAGEGELFPFRLVFSGDTDSFVIGQMVYVPADTGGGFLKTFTPVFPCNFGFDFSYSMDGPWTNVGVGFPEARVYLRCKYTDGTPKAMNISVRDVYNNEVAFLTATATVSFADWVAQALTYPSVVGIFVPTSSTGTINNGDVTQSDITGLFGIEPTAVLGSATWQFSSDAPASTGDLAGGSVEAPDGSRDAVNYNELSTPIDGDVYNSGAFIFRVVSPQGPGQLTNLFQGQWSGGEVSGYIWYDDQVGLFAHGFGPGFAHLDKTTWLTLSFRRNTSTGELFIYFGEVGAAYDSIGSVLYNTYSDFNWVFYFCNGMFRQGFSFLLGGTTYSETGNGIVRYSGIALFSDDIGTAGLSALHSSIP